MANPRRSRWKTYAGMAVSLVLGTVAAVVLWRTFQRINVADVLAQVHATPWSTLLLAASCAAAAFATLASYEVAVVRYVKQYVGRTRPIVTALIAFPLGHAIGQTMLSGGALRYRMYTPAGFSATEVGAAALLANLPYGLAFGLCLDLSLVFAASRLEPFFRISSEWLFTLGCVGLAKDFGYMLLVIARRKPIRLGGWAVPLPTPSMTVLQYVVGFIDVGLISSVLYLLLPDSAGIGYLPFLAVYLASMLAGVLSQVPAGLGVLESMLLLLMPGVPPEQLLAAVLMYRVIYEILPVLCALALWGAFEGFARDGMLMRLFGRASSASVQRGGQADHRKQ